MKVEFLESELLGPALFVAEADFKFAKANESEFDSLTYAARAFANLFGMDYIITQEEYNAALTFLEKNGTVIFTVNPPQYSEDGWVGILVSNNNRPQRVCYVDEDGYHLLRKGSPNLKMTAAIQKRSKEGQKNDKRPL